jgi:undecaprenyl-diphosphatase
MSGGVDAQRALERVEVELEQGLKQVDSPQEADVVVAHLESEAVSVPTTPEAEPVVASVPRVEEPRRKRGRRLLREAIMRRMGPLHALDAEIYVVINEAPHPGAIDSLAWALAMVTTGGWIWLIGALVAYLMRIPRSWQAFERLLPSVVITTWLIEYPIKTFFRRRRPFVRIVQALVIGKKPGSWSFPSGHTASSFASAWILSSVWPRGAPAMFGLAGMVGVSRIYLGAHYPGDVASGAMCGMLLAELTRRAVKRVLSWSL